MNTGFTRRRFLRTAATASLATASLPSALAQSDKKVTLALVGVAHIHTPGFISLLKTRDEVKVKSVWDHDASSVRQTFCSADFLWRGSQGWLRFVLLRVSSSFC